MATKKRGRIAKAFSDPSVRAAAMASQFAREIGLQAGNFWEPGISRSIEKDLREYTNASVEKHWRFRLGLRRKAVSA